MKLGREPRPEMTLVVTGQAGVARQLLRLFEPSGLTQGIREKGFCLGRPPPPALRLEQVRAGQLIVPLRQCTECPLVIDLAHSDRRPCARWRRCVASHRCSLTTTEGDGVAMFA